MCEHCQVFHGTVGPSEILYVPSGYVIWESVLDKDVVGVRWPLLLPGVAQEAFQNILLHCTTYKKNAVMVENIIKIINACPKPAAESGGENGHLPAPSPPGE